MIDLSNPIIYVAGGILLFGIISAVASLSSKEKKTIYDADFLPAGELLSRWNKGFNLTGNRALTKKASFSNCSVFGPSGSGKSSSIIVTSAFSLARGESSICFNDPSGEVYTKVSGYLAKIGYKILRIDFSRPEQSDCFNPLLRSRTISDIKQVSNLIIRNTIGDSKGDPFWDRSSEMLITLMSRYLVFYAKPEYRTMSNVLRLIETFATFPKKLDRLFVATHDEELMNSYRATIVYGDKTLQSIIATARAALNIFSDPMVMRTTSKDTIDFGLLRKEKVALFICNPIQHIHYYKPLAALFFESLFNEIMSRIPKDDEREIYFLLDEAATMRFSALSTTISNIRKYKAGIMLVVQDYQQLVALYGSAEAHNIRTNTFAQVYLKGQPLETCKELETVLGRFSYTDEKSGVEKTRILMTVDEIRKSEEAIILCGNFPPIKAKMKPYYNRFLLRRRASLPAYQPMAAQLTVPPVIPFDDGEA
jgi:type IV secretion system protein VirD4